MQEESQVAIERHAEQYCIFYELNTDQLQKNNLYNLVIALQKGVSGSFQLGTGELTSINDLISLITEVVGKGFPVQILYEDFRPGEIKHTWCDITKSRELLSFNPRIGLMEGLIQTWEWFTSR